MNSHKDLAVWQKSMDLTHKVYKLTQKIPKSETYGLVSQMQRAAVAIPSNIAEGAKRNYKAEYVQFLAIARGSAAELETQLLLAKSLYSIDVDQALGITDEVLRMLYSLQGALRKSKHL